MTSKATCLSATENLPLLINDSQELLRRGVIKITIPTSKISRRDWVQWALHLSQPTPEILLGEGDSEYVFYRNILEEPNFPFQAILQSEIGDAIVKHFGLKSLDEIEINDAFCIHYNAQQSDSSGARHVDPSDITINLCLDKADDTEGSQVLFYGAKQLSSVGMSLHENYRSASFLVDQEAGYATIHWGDHPHSTTPLTRGSRTNIVITLWYKDQSKSNVMSRTCYG